MSVHSYSLIKHHIPTSRLAKVIKTVGKKRQKDNGAKFWLKIQ